MQQGPIGFSSVAAAVAALDDAAESLVLTRFGRVPADTVIVAINDAARQDPHAPLPGERPDSRRDTDITADIELEYLFRRLLDCGFARQMVSMDGGTYYELAINRVDIDGDRRVYGFVAAKARVPA